MEPQGSFSVEWGCNRNNLSAGCGGRLVRTFFIGALLIASVVTLHGAGVAQNALPFEVSNPSNKKWSAEEAGRIYTSACDVLARAVRPEKPPQLHPRFVLVLGAENDEFVRLGSDVQIRLKSWNPGKFAEAVVMVAARDIVQAKDLQNIVHESLSLAHATVTVSELRENR